MRGVNNSFSQCWPRESCSTSVLSAGIIVPAYQARSQGKRASSLPVGAGCRHRDGALCESTCLLGSSGAQDQSASPRFTAHAFGWAFCPSSVLPSPPQPDSLALGTSALCLLQRGPLLVASRPLLTTQGSSRTPDSFIKHSSVVWLGDRPPEPKVSLSEPADSQSSAERLTAQGTGCGNNC